MPCIRKQHELRILQAAEIHVANIFKDDSSLPWERLEDVLDIFFSFKSNMKFQINIIHNL